MKRSGLLLALATTALSTSSLLAHAAPVLPTGGKVAAGQAVIGAPSGGALSIAQSSGKAIINWSSFSIGQGGKVSFQNGSGATLNRVTGGAGVSSLDGLLTATGSVYLLNPNGVIVGRSGVVNVGGGFVASTLDTPNAAFLSGGPLRLTGSSPAAVVNYGRIGSLGGDVALVAARVANAGTVTAANGDVGLLAGTSVVLTDASLDQGRFAVLLGGPQTSATNSGLIAAADAQLRAEGGNVYALAGDTAGVIRATGVKSGGGHVWLVADGGALDVAGTIEAQGAGGTPGSIETSGAQVSLGQAGVDAHGGTWTVDPVDLTIDATAASTIDHSLNAGTSVTEQTTATASSGAGTANPDGAGDIIVAAPLAWNTTARLTLSAYRNVDVNAPIAMTGGGKLTLYADNAATDLGQASGTVSFGASGLVTADSASSINVYYNPASYADAATNSTLTLRPGYAGPTIYTNPYMSHVTGGTLNAYMLVDTLAQLGGGLTGVGSELDGLYALNANLDASSTATANPIGVASGYYGFIPIGYTGQQNQSNAFTGAFDGQGHTISNLYVNHLFYDTNNNVQNTDSTGLFGVVSAGPAGAGNGGGVVENLGLIDPTTNGQSFVGTLVGQLNSGATASNVYATGVSVTGGYSTGGLLGVMYGGILSGAYTTGQVTAGSRVGGLVGSTYPGTITNSYSSAAVDPGVTTEVDDVGGLVGAATGGSILTNVYATGPVTGGYAVGGLTGAFGGTLTNAYSTSPITSAGYTGQSVYFGGLIGDLQGGSTVTNTHATQAVSTPGGLVGGLIGDVESGGTVTNSYATGAVSATGASGGNAGGLIGYANPGYTVSDSFATGSVTGGYSVGGLIGQSFAGTITQSYASGAVSGGGNLGGLVANATDYGASAAGLTISDSYATGSVTETGPTSAAATSYIGGLVGYSAHDEPTAGATTTLTHDYAIGLVSGPAVQGGLIGGYTGVISNSIWDRTTTGQANGFGVQITTYGNSASPVTTSVTNLTSVQDTDPTAADYAFSATPYTNAGFLFGTTPGEMLNINGTLTAAPWVQIDDNGTLNGRGGSTIGTRPILLMEYSTTITTAHQLQLMELNTAANYTLGSNVDASGTAGLSDVWGPGGFIAVGQDGYATSTYSGLFEGAGRTISGLTINDTDESHIASLFGYIGTGGVVQNLKLSGGGFSSIYAAGPLAFDNLGHVNDVSASAPVAAPNAGGLVANNDGTITNASASGIVSSPATNTRSFVALGGLAGSNNGIISGSSASGTVTDNDTAIVEESGTGGLVGLDQGVISNSSASGAVTSLVDPASGGLLGLMVGNGSFGVASVVNSSASGAVNGARDAGGLIGEAYSASASDAVVSGDSATGPVSGTFEVGGLIGSTTADISTSHASGAVTASAGTAGGLIGSLGVANNGTQFRVGVMSTDSYATGSVTVVSPTGFAGVIGGLVGLAGPGAQITGSAANLSYATGAVSAPSGANAPYAGGLLGLSQGATVTNSYATGSVSGSGYVGGLVGSANYGFNTQSGQTTYYYTAISGSHASGAATSTGSEVGGLVGENAAGSVADSYATGAVSGANQVGGLVGFNDMATYVNQAPATSPTPSITGSAAGRTYATGTVTGAGTATGGLVGESQGAITLASYSNAGAGVNGAADAGGAVGLNDMGATLTSVSVSAPVASTSYTGGLVGDNFGSVTGGGYAGAVSGGGGVGGGVGVNEGGATVSGPTLGGTTAVTVTGTTNDIGGVAGANFGAVTANVADANVNGQDHVGGVVGSNYGSVSGSFYGAVTGRNYVGGEVGLNYGSVAAGVSGAVSGGEYVAGWLAGTTRRGL